MSRFFITLMTRSSVPIFSPTNSVQQAYIFEESLESAGRASWALCEGSAPLVGAG